MVSSVTSAPYYSYLNQLQGVADSNATPAATGTASSAAATSSASGASSTAQSLVSSLLGKGNGFSSEALSLLQENSSGSFDPITSLLGGTGTNDATTSLYTNLYDSVSAAALTQAKDQNPSQTQAATGGSSSGSGASTPSKPNVDPVEALINEQTQASVAYNQTLQQNTANAVRSIIQA